MGNSHCSCVSSNSPKHSRKLKSHKNHGNNLSIRGNGNPASGDSRLSVPKLQHIRDREQIDDLDETKTPSDHAQASTMFISIEQSENHDKRSSLHKSTSPGSTAHKRRSSCSTIYIDDSTVSQPNIKSSIRCVSLAVFYHIKHRDSVNKHLPDVFDEKLHPLTKQTVPFDYTNREPDHKQIYKFIRTLFSAAQLTAECAIVTLIYVERLLTYAEICICPANWKRIILGAIILASKVWDDQAVWNVDYCQILKDISVEDMNEMERQFLELLNFNINVPSSVYAKYYFDLRSLADRQNLLFSCEPLSKERAQKLELLQDDDDTISVSTAFETEHVFSQISGSSVTPKRSVAGSSPMLRPSNTGNNSHPFSTFNQCNVWVFIPRSLCNSQSHFQYPHPV